MRFVAILGALAASMPFAAHAGPLQDTPDPVVVAFAGTTIPAGTAVDFQFVDHVNSKTSHNGDHFRIRTTKPILVDGVEAVPVGAEGEGEVIHAARARAAGKAGELILAARFIEYRGQRIALRSFRFGVSGDSKTDEAIALGLIVAGPLAFLVVGGEVDVQPMTDGHAKVAADTIVTPADRQGH
ncbi:hypothetical protein J3E64_002459 [Sphingobium sp. OAS761]|uniref:hypothetical protein n=1 Tax=Sphingobium sp. OAS761 TaxID=2817901 RepID=UPI00209CF4A6|nr:hypothetical protein [Sphingobium sp. OAS761]MCP1470766.1 hypothetical protein [Sphingobium sp. OAS761]